MDVIEVEPIRYEQLIEILKEGNDSVIRRRDGFISCVILASADRSRVITVARWEERGRDQGGRERSCGS